MSNTYHRVFSALILINTTITIVVCLGVLIRLLTHHRLYRRTNINVIWIYLTNTYTFLLAFSISVVVINANILNDHIWCRLSGFSFYACYLGIYMSCCLQALFRLSRLLHQRHVWLQRSRFHIVFVVASWFLAFLLISPVYSHIVYLPDESCCLILFADPMGSIYASVVIVALPMLSLILTYVRIILLMRGRSFSTMIHHRETIVTCRIVLILWMFVETGAPAAVFIIMFLVNGYLYPLAYNVQLLFSTLGMVALSIALVLVTPQLRFLLCHRRRTGPLPAPKPQMPLRVAPGILHDRF